jgi:NAD(P)-dependent dehydrogenase (short-subunit alcohol dehydrogenase family)
MAASRRFVVVTGGSRGIGREVVKQFAEIGDEVLALGRDEQALATLADLDSTIRTAVCDVADEAQVASIFDTAGPVDILVNNAGVASGAPLHRTTLEAWNHMVGVNATGAFLCTRAVIAGMRERGSGSIITVASTAGLTGEKYTGAYTASKHAAVGLMRVAAAELAGSGATANAVCPSYVDTDMTRATIENISRTTGRSIDESTTAVLEMTSLGRMLTAEEVAAKVVWLASDDARAINGATIVLGGEDPA